MTNRWLRLGLIAGVAGPLAYFLIQPALILCYPGYDITRQVVSEFGARGAPTASVFNPAVIAIGLMMTASGAAQFLSLRRWTAWPLALAATTCVAILGLATVVAGIFPLPDPRHAAGGPFVAAGLAYPVLMTLALWRHPRWRWVFAACVLGVAAAALVMFGIIELDRERWQGLIQRPVALSVFGPMGLGSSALLRLGCQGK